MRLGTAFHEVMERVDLKDLAGLTDLLHDAETRNNLDGASRRKLEFMLEKCLNSGLMQRARNAARTGGRVLREMPFIRPMEGGGVEEGRIDLLFEEGGVWTIVDYKTGRIPRNTQNTKAPEDTDDTDNMNDADDAAAYFRNRYADQARAYRGALESLSLKTGGVFLLIARTGGVIEL